MTAGFGIMDNEDGICRGSQLQYPNKADFLAELKEVGLVDTDFYPEQTDEAVTAQIQEFLARWCPGACVPNPDDLHPSHYHHVKEPGRGVWKGWTVNLNKIPPSTWALPLTLQGGNRP